MYEPVKNMQKKKTKKKNRNTGSDRHDGILNVMLLFYYGVLPNSQQTFFQRSFKEIVLMIFYFTRLSLFFLLTTILYSVNF